ncbi:MAG: membrane-bound lytic murein transglycosylase MltF [Gammaproteobacteria bacterium]|nr:membrane-bound lytic murein transglycosylase MltF [Gammaproteobacteria bacterium]
MFTLALLAACTRPTTGLQDVHQRGQLRVVTLNEPTSYYLGAHGAQGLEYRLTHAFAESLGVQLVIQPVRDAAAMRDVLDDGGADLAAAQISASTEWKRVGLTTHTYDDVQQLVIQRRGSSRPPNISGLEGARIAVRAGSPQLSLLREIRGNGAPYLAWTELSPEQADPLDWVRTGDADYAIVDANEYAFARHLYPEVMIAFKLPDPRPVQWIVRRDGLDLRDAANRFFHDARQSGLLARIRRDSTLESAEFQYLEAQRFQQDIAEILPRLRPWFEEASQDSGLDWRLLAAVGYQESKWQPRAVSPNGAQGIMMLMADTAGSVGVRDRFDPQQSIHGGARYLAQVIATIPTRIPEPDRTWLALASYNVGYGHLEDARVLAQMQGRNPDAWEDVKLFLPLLAQPQWHTRVKRGYARGWEPVKFVEQVRGFLAVLEWKDPAAAAAAATMAAAATDPAAAVSAAAPLEKPRQ